MNRQWQTYKELELIPDQPPLQQVNSFTAFSTDCTKNCRNKRTSWLRTLWEVIDVALLRNLEPRVWQSVNPQTGRTHWHLYDPISGTTHHLNSETEVRQWLEQVFNY